MLLCVAGFFLEIEILEGENEGLMSVIGVLKDVVMSMPP
jgi:hypothetical protein